MSALPSRIGAYRILRVIGEGGMGVVYEATKEDTDHRLALKVLADDVRDDPDLRLRFLREGRAACAVRHPNVARAFESGEASDQLYLAMEFVEGPSLRQYMRQGAPPIAEALSIARAITAGVGAAHACGLVHRDLKPENIIVPPGGDVKVLDFGLAKRAVRLEGSDGVERDETSTLTAEGTIVGSPGYMAPEQVTAKAVDHRTDIFAIGILLYELVTGGLPFTGESHMLAMVAAALQPHVPMSERRPGVATGLDAIVDRCLAKAKPERFQSCEELVMALDELIEADRREDRRPTQP